MAKRLPTKTANTKSANQQLSSPSPATQQQHTIQSQQLPLPGTIQHAQRSAPYPPPDAVERYEALLPGAFDRIIAMAEQLQAAQIEQSRRALDHQNENSRRGHWLGFATTVLAVAGAGFCAWIGRNWVAAAFLSVPAMAVAKALVDAAKAPKR
jgi:uncharacterized membrane protein